MSTTHIILVSLPFSAKNYQNWWKFEEVLTKAILQFFETRCTEMDLPSVI